MPRTRQYVNGIGETRGAYAGTELDKVLAADPEWQAVGKRRPQAAQAPSETPAGDTPSDPPADLIAQLRPELDKLAAELGIEGAADLRAKADVVAAIEAAQAPSE